MPRRISLSREVQLLQEKKASLKAEMSCLAESRRSLLLRHLLLQAWCECLELTSVCGGPAVLAPNSASTNQEALMHVAEAEGLQLDASLLRQLTSGSSSGSSYAAAAADVLHPGVQTIAPVGDPMSYFRHHVFRPPLEAAATMTALDLARMLRDATLQGSVLLHALQFKPAEAVAPIQEQLSQMWDRVLHASVSLISIGREDIVETLNFMNLDTLQPDAEGSQQTAALVPATVQALQLTPKQTAIIATGTGLYRRLLQNILNMRLKLQMEFSRDAAAVTATAAAPDGDSSRPAAAAAAAQGEGGADPQHQQHQQHQQRQHQFNSQGSSGANGGSSSIWTDSFDSRQAQLKAEQERMARLRQLMQKEYILRMGGAAWVVGCLSWAQVTHAAVLSWPFPVSFSVIASEIQRQWDAQQQQEQQQQQERRAQPTEQNTPQHSSGATGGSAVAGSQLGSSSMS